jgi:hypothetical protein
LVTIVFANNFLNARIAENEFGAMKQFMQTVGLQLDDVAWTIGRAQTVRYASKFGQVNYVDEALTYTVYLNDETDCWANFTTGILLFNMPIAMYSLGNDYYESVFPSNRSFIHMGASAPVSYVYVVEKLPMVDGSFIRVVVVPTIRVLNSKITTDNYFKFYLPILSAGTHPRRSQSVTLTGKNVSVKTASNVNTVKINVSFPESARMRGFDADFFNFEKTEVVVDVPDGSIIEFYTGEVTVSLGLHG